MLDGFISLFNKFGMFIVNILPKSPFREFINTFEIPYIKWFNWFFPTENVLKIMAAWLGAVAIYYAWQVVGRWVKVIGG